MDLARLTKALQNPVTWTREILKRELWQGQVEMMETCQRHSRVLIRSANAVGKSFALACYLLWFLAAYDDADEPGMVLTTSTSERQIEQSSIWLDLRRIIADPDIEFEYPKPTLTKLQMRHSYATGFSAQSDRDDSGVRWGGWHSKGPILIICDEASGINPSVFKGIEGIRASGNVTVVLLANPLVNSGYVYDAATKNRGSGGYRTLSYGVFDTPNFANWSVDDLMALPPDVPEDAEVFQYKPWPQLCRRRWAWEMIAEYGVSSPIVAARVFGNFPSSGTDNLFDLQWLEAINKRPIPTERSGRIRAAADIAGPGRDLSVLAKRDGPVILDMKNWRTDDVRGEIAAELIDDRDAIETLTIDSNGLGYHLATFFQTDLGYPVEFYNGANNPRDKERFANRRAEDLWG